MIAQETRELGGHFVYLDTDDVPGLLDPELEKPGGPGVLTIHRTLPPEPGSGIRVRYPDGFTRPASRRG